MLPPSMPLGDANTQQLRDAMESLARCRRDALLQELADLEHLLHITPTTSELRRAWRASGAQAETVKLKEG